MITITPEATVDTIRHLMRERTESLVVFWVAVTHGRAAFCTRVHELAGEYRLIPLAVRDSSFTVPNSVIADLYALLEKEKKAFDRVRAPDEAPIAQLTVLLVSLAPLAVPQLSSPGMLPEWFPVAQREQAEIHIRDITAAVACPLNSPTVRIAQLCRALFELEMTLHHRLTQTHNANPRCTNSLLDRLRTPELSGERFDDILQLAADSRTRVQNPEGFRPSVRDGRFLLARLLRMVAGCTPEQLMKAAGSLRRALALPSDRGCSDSLLAVLFRSTNPSNDADIRATHGFLVCLYAASQLVTAAAHADDYPAYPEHLLISMSLEMRRYLHEFDSLVRSAPPVPPRNP